MHDRTPDYCCSSVHYKSKQRKLCPYNDKRYLLANLPDGRPKLNTHSYCHRDLTAEKHLVADQLKPGAKLIIRHRTKRFARIHARVTRRLEFAGKMEILKKLLNGDADGKLLNEQLLIIEQMAAARPNGAFQISDVIERIIARDNFERPVLLLAPMPVPQKSQRAKPSKLNDDMLHFCRFVDLSNNKA